MKVLVLFYSAYGHIYELAKAVAEGAKTVEGVEVEIKQVPETLPAEILEKTGMVKTRAAFEHIPVATIQDLAEADGIIFGTPSRFGSKAYQMKAFVDGTGSLRAKNSLTGKVGSVFTSTGTQHGGQETTILTFYPVLLHHGMIVAGLPYDFKGQSRMDEITGCSPYGASTIASAKDSPTENELEGARFQGAYVADIVRKLKS